MTGVVLEKKSELKILEQIIADYNLLNEIYSIKSNKDITPLHDSEKETLYVAGFTSNSGAIINVALELQKYLEDTRGYSPFKINFLFSDTTKPQGDNPFFETRDLHELSSVYNVPVMVSDMDAFYNRFGFKSKKDPALSKERKADIRACFDSNVVEHMNSLEHKPASIILDYYWSICSPKITDNYLAINSHLGDLSVVNQEGKRLLAGFYPVRNAMFLGHNAVYSTTHIADSKVDNGDLFLQSKPLFMNIREDAKKFIIELPEGGEIQYLKENLKELNLLEDFYESQMRTNCDSHILPLTLLLVAEGRFARDKENNMYFNGNRIYNSIRI